MILIIHSLRVWQDQGEAEGLEGGQWPQGSRGDKNRPSIHLSVTKICYKFTKPSRQNKALLV